MKTIILFILITIFFNLSQFQQISGLSISRALLDAECLKYEDDNKIIDANPFIQRNPIYDDPNKSSVEINRIGRATSLRIINQKEIPLSIYCLKYLTKLELRNIDSKEEFPLILQHLPLSIVELSIHNTKANRISNEISRLINLRHLRLENTNLMVLSHYIGDLKELTTLTLIGTKLRELPNTMKNLQKLKRIILTNNPQLSSIQSLNDLSSLEYIDARECSISLLPKNLSKLMDLLMSKNRLISLNGIKTLGYGTNSSKIFSFNQNFIQAIPLEIEFVRNLLELNLRQNHLNSIPTNIYNVKTLKKLNIMKNNFTSEDLKITVTRLRQEMPYLKVIYD